LVAILGVTGWLTFAVVNFVFGHEDLLLSLGKGAIVSAMTCMLLYTVLVALTLLGAGIKSRFEFDVPHSLEAIQDEGESSQDYWDRWEPRPVLG
jgi:hypothetical protein